MVPVFHSSITVGGTTHRSVDEDCTYAHICNDANIGNNGGGNKSENVGVDSYVMTSQLIANGYS